MTFAYFFAALALASVSQLASGDECNPYASATSQRGTFSNDDFIIDFAKKSPIVTSPGRRVELGNVDTFPFLGLPDIQMSINRFQLDNNVENPLHVHPRGAELIYVIKGVVELTIAAESGAAELSITLNPAQSSVVPQAVAHKQLCRTESGCEYVGVLNGPDAGNFGIKTLG